MAGQLSPDRRLTRLRRAGALTLAAALLAIVALVGWAAAVALQPRARYVVRPDQPVFGVSVGSPVRLRGVVVGEVAAVRLWSASPGGRLRPEIALSVDTRRHPELARLGAAVEDGLRVEFIPVNPGAGFLEVDLVWSPGSPVVRATDDQDELPCLPAPFGGVGRLAAALSSLARSDPPAFARRLAERLDSAALGLDEPGERARAMAAAAADLRSLAARAEAAAEPDSFAERRARLSEARERLAQLSQRLEVAADQLARAGIDAPASLRDRGRSLRAVAEEARAAEAARRGDR